MKIILSKTKWEEAGIKAGWMKKAQYENQVKPDQADIKKSIAIYLQNSPYATEAQVVQYFSGNYPPPMISSGDLLRLIKDEMGKKVAPKMNPAQVTPQKAQPQAPQKPMTQEEYDSTVSKY